MPSMASECLCRPRETVLCCPIQSDDHDAAVSEIGAPSMALERSRKQQEMATSCGSGSDHAISYSCIVCSYYSEVFAPSMASERSRRPRDTAISAAPPPGTSRGSATTLRATPIASCRLRSTSLSVSLLAPLSTTEHALGSCRQQHALRVVNASPEEMQGAWLTNEHEFNSRLVLA
jgi:hypothetical protein